MTLPASGSTVPQPRRLSGNVVGMLAMTAAMGCFCFNDAFVKLVGHNLPISEIVTIRGLIAFVMLFPLALWFGVLRHVPQLIQVPVLMRVVGESAATGLFLVGLVNMPFAEANSVLQFTPLAVTAGSAVFLGERVGWRRWLAAAVGLLGVLMIIRPGTGAFSWYSLPLFGSVLCVVVRDLGTRQIATGIPTLLLATLSSVSVTVFGLGLSLFESWTTPDRASLGHLFGAAVFLVLGYFTSTIGLRTGEISAVAPFRYSVVLFAIGTGYAIWGEVPDLWTVIGVMIVAAAGLYTFHRERWVSSRLKSGAARGANGIQTGETTA